MNNKIDIKILSKYLDGTASPEEQLIIEAWLAESGENAPLFEEEESPDAVMYREAAKTAVLEQMQLYEEPEVPPRRNWRVVALRVAVAAAVLGAIAIVGYQWRKLSPVQPVAMRQKKEPVSRNRAMLALFNGQQITLETLAIGQAIQVGAITISKTDTNEIRYQVTGGELPPTAGTNQLTVPKSSQYAVVLADGTKVWLNAGSSISFPAAFAGNSRKVGITGEAYFEVAKQLTANGSNYQPFSVATEKVEVLVLGTHFNINAYTNEPAVKTTLLEGSVQVKTNKQKIQIRPGQQAQLNHTGQLSVAQPNLEEVTAWKKGYLQFDDTPLEEVFRQIARWYDVEVIFKGTSPQGSFHGKVYPGMTLPEILRGLEVNGARFTFNGTKIIVE
ncbi:MAG: FecR domain-containing protein [Chitinophaga sp.]|uniref:FecR family protein n=1 Tax=Chitinophaga sp. TaxID=1869181 RepID=UPI001AFD212E|nr:FecR family protein [Chitinophaga sp.]MBO9732474.1 FecR domain-containing protein [Chitinophaga sp.]